MSSRPDVVGNFVVASQDDLVQTFSEKRCPAQKKKEARITAFQQVAYRRFLLRREGSTTVGQQEASSTE